MYQLLPFRFERFSPDKVLLSNEAGEFVFLPPEAFAALVHHTLPEDGPEYRLLESRQFLAAPRDVKGAASMLAVKYRTKKSILRNFTTLHMIVPTLRCNSSCIYCQVARKRLDDIKHNMTEDTADKVLQTVFSSPSPEIKIEFQGGDPSTHFPMVQYLIERAEIMNLRCKKNLEFVICTNLILLTVAQIRYLHKHRCYISTSLDGPEDIHNANRPLQDKSNTYRRFIDKLAEVRAITGDNEYASPLMTASRYSLGRFKDIIDEYVRLGFHSIFLRSLNPYGFAKNYQQRVAYPIEDFIQSYIEGLDYIIELNRRGTHFVEGYAAMLLRRILTPFATGFVDLQSPAGTGIACALYDWNGDVFVSDEGRMLSRMKDFTFRLGNVHTHTYREMFDGELMHRILHEACTECLPECCQCVYQPYCGADPVRNYSEQGDMTGFRPTNDMCRKNKAIFRHLFELLQQDDPELQRIFWSWIR